MALVRRDLASHPFAEFMQSEAKYSLRIAGDAKGVRCSSGNRSREICLSALVRASLERYFLQEEGKMGRWAAWLAASSSGEAGLPTFLCNSPLSEAQTVSILLSCERLLPAKAWLHGEGLRPSRILSTTKRRRTTYEGKRRLVSIFGDRILFVLFQPSWWILNLTAGEVVEESLRGRKQPIMGINRSLQGLLVFQFAACPGRPSGRRDRPY